MRREEFSDLKNYIYGSTAAIITDISLIVGMGSAGTSKGPILCGLLTIALADNISDSLSIQMYQEADGVVKRLSWQTTALNFLARVLVCLSFAAVVLIFSVAHAIPVAVVWGILLVVLLSYWGTARARMDNRSRALQIGKYLLIAVAVMVASRYVGILIAAHFPPT